MSMGNMGIYGGAPSSGACTSIGCAKDRMMRSALRYEVDRCTETITRLQQERDKALAERDDSAAREAKLRIAAEHQLVLARKEKIDSYLTGIRADFADHSPRGVPCGGVPSEHEERDRTRYQIEELRLLKQDAYTRGFKAGRAHAIARIAVQVTNEPGSNFSALKAAALLEDIVGHKDSSQDFDQ